MEEEKNRICSYYARKIQNDEAKHTDDDDGKSRKRNICAIFFTKNFSSHVSPGECRIEMRVAQHVCLQK